MQEESIEEEKARTNLQIVLATLMTTAVLIIPITSISSEYKGKYDNYNASLINAISENVSEEYISNLRSYLDIYQEKTIFALVSLICVVMASFSSLFGIFVFAAGHKEFLGRRLTVFIGYLFGSLVFSIFLLVAAIFGMLLALVAFILAFIGGLITLLIPYLKRER